MPMLAKEFVHLKMYQTNAEKMVNIDSVLHTYHTILINSDLNPGSLVH